jgi:hypothetical protein
MAGVISDGGESPTIKAPPGWYPDPWTPSRRRYWTGTTWTFATTEAVPVDHPPPEDASPLGEGHRLPDPVVPRSAAGTTGGVPAAPAPAKPPQRPVKWVLAVVVGLLVGGVGVFLSTRDSSKPKTSSPPESAAGPTPTTAPSPGGASANNDPSTASLASLVVKPEDVPSTASVVVFTGGVGLGQPTLDLCNATYPSESRRSARLQDAVLDAQSNLVLSTEAVLYRDSAGTTEAFAELRSAVGACPSTPVQSPVGQPAVATTFNAPPDATWQQVPSVNRLAFDLTTVDATGKSNHTIAVYLQRGRALLGVYFSQPDGPQSAVEGQTTIPGIVGVFAGRLAALPTSVVGS